MRLPYQILIFPYLKTGKNPIKYCLFKRQDTGIWQGIAGGGEEGETPLKTAKRELLEEAGIISDCKIIQLKSTSSIPVKAIGDYNWGKDISTLPEYSFGVEVKSEQVLLSGEHIKYKWLFFDEAQIKLKWDSNRKALKELNQILKDHP